MATATSPFPAPQTTPQGAVPFVSIPDSWDYPRLVYVAPYFTTVPLAELIDPSVKESIESLLPSLVPPYVQDAANTAVANLAVVKTGSTMTGPLFLNGLPTQPTQAATMSYVDMMVATSGVPEVPAAPSGQTWGRQTGQWVAIASASGTFLPLSGGTMQGALNMGGNSITNLPAVPQAPYGAANMTWVLDQIAAQSLYQGTWNADNNTPDLTQPGTHQNEFSWIATTVVPAGVVVSQPIPGIQGLTVYNGDNLIYSAFAGQFQVIHAGGLTAPQADARYLMLTGGTMSGALLLNADPTQPMQAATRQFVIAQATFPEAPTDGQLYGRSGLNHNWGSVLSTAGGVLTGALTLAANAVTSLNAVPLQQLTSTLGNYVAMAGNATITGPITMAGAPATLTLAQNAATNLQAVPLQQLTSTLAAYLPLTGGTLTGALGVQAGITSSGSNAGLNFVERDTANQWLWYAQGGTAHLYQTGGDRITVNSAGTLNAGGHVWAGQQFLGPNAGNRPSLYDPTGNHIGFQYGTNATGSLIYPTWANSAANHYLVQGTNATALGLFGGTGGPTAVSLNVSDNGNATYGIYVDVLCDARVKTDIRDTEVDALAALCKIPVRSFNWRAEVMAHYATINAGLTDEERQNIRAAATTAPVPIGLVAQEIVEIIPDAARALPSGTKQPEDCPIPDDALYFNDAAFVPYLVRALQQVTARLETLEALTSA